MTSVNKRLLASCLRCRAAGLALFPCRPARVLLQVGHVRFNLSVTLRTSGVRQRLLRLLLEESICSLAKSMTLRISCICTRRSATSSCTCLFSS